MMTVPLGDSLPACYGEEGEGSCDPEGTRNRR